MPDWSGGDGGTTAQRYREMAEHGVRGVSPSYEAICWAVADDLPVLARLDTLPIPKRQPNLLLAAVRFLGGSTESWTAFRAFVLDRWDDVSAIMMTRRTQTNEAARCTTFLPVLAALQQPLALLEVGASAGLCLYPDRYAYRYVSGSEEHVVGSSPVELRCTVSGPVDLPTALPEVVWRAGLDLHPLDVGSADDVRWLDALVWPEQADRAATLHAAVDLVRRDPPRIVRGDLLSDLAAVAGDAPVDATLVVFHSAVLAYVAEADRVTFVDELDELRASRPVCWLSNEAPDVVTGTGVDAGGRTRFVLARDARRLALAGQHGATLDWLAEQ